MNRSTSGAWSSKRRADGDLIRRRFSDSVVRSSDLPDISLSFVALEKSIEGVSDVSTSMSNGKISTNHGNRRERTHDPIDDCERFQSDGILWHRLRCRPEVSAQA